MPTAIITVPAAKPSTILLTPLYLRYRNATGKINIDAAKKLAQTPTGSPPPITKYRKFFIPKTIIPAKGENIKAAINAGTSPKSTLRYGVGKKGNGKFKKNSKNEIDPNNAKIIILTNL